MTGSPLAARRQLLDAQRQLLRLADHGVVGHLVDHEAAVPLAGLAGQQEVQGRIDAQALEVGGTSWT